MALEIANLLKVNMWSVASPEKRLLLLAPLFERRPFPFDILLSISSELSLPLEEIIRLSFSFSIQRNAGMLLLFPWSIPACDDDVWLERSVSHFASSWLPPSSHFVNVGMSPFSNAFLNVL